MCNETRCVTWCSAHRDPQNSNWTLLTALCVDSFCGVLSNTFRHHRRRYNYHRRWTSPSCWILVRSCFKSISSHLKNICTRWSQGRARERQRFRSLGREKWSIDSSLLTCCIITIISGVPTSLKPTTNRILPPPRDNQPMNHPIAPLKNNCWYYDL